MVRGIRANTSSATGVWVISENPRFPETSDRIHVTYCSGIGRSRPYNALREAAISANTNVRAARPRIAWDEAHDKEDDERADEQGREGAADTTDQETTQDVMPLRTPAMNSPDGSVSPNPRLT